MKNKQILLNIKGSDRELIKKLYRCEDGNAQMLMVETLWRLIMPQRKTEDDRIAAAAIAFQVVGSSHARTLLIQQFLLIAKNDFESTLRAFMLKFNELRPTLSHSHTRLIHSFGTSKVTIQGNCYTPKGVARNNSPQHLWIDVGTSSITTRLPDPSQESFYYTISIPLHAFANIEFTVVQHTATRPTLHHNHSNMSTNPMSTVSFVIEMQKQSQWGSSERPLVPMDVVDAGKHKEINMAFNLPTAEAEAFITLVTSRQQQLNHSNNASTMSAGLSTASINRHDLPRRASLHSTSRTLPPPAGVPPKPTATATSPTAATLSSSYSVSQKANQLLQQTSKARHSLPAPAFNPSAKTGPVSSSPYRELSKKKNQPLASHPSASTTTTHHLPSPTAPQHSTDITKHFESALTSFDSYNTNGNPLSSPDHDERHYTWEATDHQVHHGQHIDDIHHAQSSSDSDDEELLVRFDAPSVGRTHIGAGSETTRPTRSNKPVDEARRESPKPSNLPKPAAVSSTSIATSSDSASRSEASSRPKYRNSAEPEVLIADKPPMRGKSPTKIASPESQLVAGASLSSKSSPLSETTLDAQSPTIGSSADSPTSSGLRHKLIPLVDELSLYSMSSPPLLLPPPLSCAQSKSVHLHIATAPPLSPKQQTAASSFTSAASSRLPKQSPAKAIGQHQQQQQDHHQHQERSPPSHTVANPRKVKPKPNSQPRPNTSPDTASTVTIDASNESTESYAISSASEADQITPPRKSSGEKKRPTATVASRSSIALSEAIDDADEGDTDGNAGHRRKRISPLNITSESSSSHNQSVPTIQPNVPSSASNSNTTARTPLSKHSSFAFTSSSSPSSPSSQQQHRIVSTAAMRCTPDAPPPPRTSTPPSQLTTPKSPLEKRLRPDSVPFSSQNAAEALARRLFTPPQTPSPTTAPHVPSLGSSIPQQANQLLELIERERQAIAQFTQNRKSQLKEAWRQDLDEIRSMTQTAHEALDRVMEMTSKRTEEFLGASVVSLDEYSSMSDHYQSLLSTLINRFTTSHLASL